MKKTVILLGFFFFVNSVFAQKSIHNYKYVVIPNKFNFFKYVDKYQTNSLTKFLFNKYGYKAYLNSETLPEDFKENKCLALFLNLKDDSGMIRTKTSIVLKDCNGVIVFKSKQGRSKEKDIKKSYHEAIRDAFESVKALNYKYKPVVVQKVKENILPIKSKVIVSSLLYAKINSSGYRLVDTTSTVVFILLKTNNANVFIIKDRNGVLYKVNDSWIAEFYRNGKRIQKEYTIQF